MPMINEAIFAVMEGVGTPEAIDTVMKRGMNHPMGPLTLADFIGLDVCLAILNVLHDGLGDPKYRPCPLLRRMVAAGHLGRKIGPGLLRVRVSHHAAATTGTEDRQLRAATARDVDRRSPRIENGSRRSVGRKTVQAGDEPVDAERPQRLNAERRDAVDAEPVEQQVRGVRGARTSARSAHDRPL